MVAPLPRPEDYDVSPEHGFLPSEAPLTLLSSSYYEPWETVFQNLQGLVLSKRIRGVVDGLEELSTDFLATEAEWRRAYTVLGFLVHAYIWGGNAPADRIPPPLSVPFLSVCKHFEVPPVATYAGLVLWNWRPLFANEPMDSLENVATLNTFTGSTDESWFYLVSVVIEARAGPLMPLMLEAMAAARRDDGAVVTECLRTLAERLDELGSLLERMYENCDAHVFYHRIRPFLAGSKNMADAGLPRGVQFDDGSGHQPYVQFSGGSNAQSSVIQFFDLVLDVQHRPTGVKGTGGTDGGVASHQTSGSPPSSNNFLDEMRKYMPGPHRRFLEHVASVANVREYVASRGADRGLVTAFDACLAMLRVFRDKHIQMVSRYIIVKSREPRASPAPASPKLQRTNIAHGSSSSGSGTTTKTKDGLRGTGGTALIPFLKQARDETGEPAMDAWARRLLNNSGAGPGGRVAQLTKTSEHANGELRIVGLAGTWSVHDSDGGICHW